MVMRTCSLLVAALALGACADFEDPDIVIDLRVLAIAADKPELVLDFDPQNPLDVVPQLEANPVTVQVLVADPAAQRRLEWDMTACPPTNEHRCDPEDPWTFVASGSVEDPEVTFDPPTGTFVVGVDVLDAAVRADSLLGFGGVAIQVQVRIWPEGGDADAADTLWASKRIVYAPRVPAERTPNNNPTVTGLTINEDPTRLLAPGRCGDPTTTPNLVAPEEELVLTPIEPEGVREMYVLPTFDGGTRRITENLRYAWLATGGSWTAGSTGGPTDAFGNPPTLDTTWTAPREATSDIRLWMVQRDERGGLTWNEYCVHVGL